MTFPSRRALLLAACLLVALPAVAPPAHAEETGGCSLIAHVTGFRNTKGVLGAVLFRSTDGWPESVKKSLRHAHFPIEGDHATARFDHLPPGSYGLAVLHDENSNQKLDRDMFFIPKEGFGFANNPRVLMAAPPMDKAMVTVRCPETTTNIHLIYK